MSFIGLTVKILLKGHHSRSQMSIVGGHKPQVSVKQTKASFKHLLRDIYVSRKQLQENNHRKVSAIIVKLNPCKLTRTYLAIFSQTLVMSPGPAENASLCSELNHRSQCIIGCLSFFLCGSGIGHCHLNPQVKCVLFTKCLKGHKRVVLSVHAGRENLLSFLWGCQGWMSSKKHGEGVGVNRSSSFE